MMKEVKDISLYFITSCEDSIRTLKEIYYALDHVVSPSDLLEKIPDYRDAITKLDSRISVDKTRIQRLTSAYKTQIEQKNALLLQYQNQIEQRMLSQHQLNTNVTFYDEEKLLSKSCYSEFEENPSEYSMLSIVKRILNDESDNIECMEKALEENESIYKWFIDAQTNILRVKTMFDDNAFVSLFTSEYMSKETNDQISDLRRFMRNIEISLSNAKEKVRKIFQMFVAQSNDYEIYANVVERFNTVALESYFSAGVVTSGVI